MADFITYTHIDSSIITVNDLLSSADASIIRIGSLTKIELFAYELNLDNIYNQYTPLVQYEERIAYSMDKVIVFNYKRQKELINKLPKDQRLATLSDFSSALQINQLDINTPLSIPYTAINQEVPFVQSNQTVPVETFKEFFVPQLRFLEVDSNYRKVTTDLDGSLGVLVDELPQATVWIWCKALGGPNDKDGKIINVTPFISSLNTNVGANGGNWNVDLAPIIGKYVGTYEYDPINYQYGGGQWVIDDVDIRIEDNGFNYLSTSNILKRTIDGKEFERNKFYFHNVVQENDIVFIRFETLRNELGTNAKLINNFEIPISQLSKHHFDMIGLVDSNGININDSNNQVNINIQGRDLIKLLIDDGTYFFPIEHISGGVFVDNEENELAKNRVEGKLHLLSINIQKSIDFTLKFIINALSNITVCPDSIFNSYRNTRYITGFNELTGEFETSVGDIRSKKLVIETDKTNNIAANQLYFGLDSVVENIIDIDQQIENETDEGVRNSLELEKEALEEERDRIGEDIAALKKEKLITGSEMKEMNGIWQIIDLVVDRSVEQYRIVDSSLGNEMGSILNAVNKACQQPFVEFFSDTYMNKFYFIVRRPPFDKLGYQNLAKVALEVKVEDVFSENLTFDKRDIYSWYRLDPQGAIDEMGQNTVWAYLKAIRFKEYAEIYGDKAYQQVSNYIHYQSIVGEENNINVNSVTREYMRDLKYIIESNQYNPFVRRGTIVIHGDRRIKRGSIIHYKPTNEYCYVESVGQSYINNESTVERVTNIQVSHCMVADYLDKYFSIIDLPMDDSIYDKSSSDFIDGVDRLMSNWKVNVDNFNFFLKRAQFK